MSNFILFSHCDLDGIGAGVIFRRIYGNNAEIHYCGYHSIDDKVATRIKELRKEDATPDIYITDISISRPVANMLENYEGNVLLFDHHESAKWLAESYVWATVDTTKSGTKLLYEYFCTLYGHRFHGLELFVELVNDYDLWIHDNPQSKELNRLFYILGIDRFERRMIESPFETFTYPELLLLELEDETIERYLRKVERGLDIFDWDEGIQAGIAYADRFQSEIGHELMERFGLDVIALIDINGKKVSLRSRRWVNVSEIAKELGGGGHKNASGFALKKRAIPSEELNELLKESYQKGVTTEFEKLFLE